MKPRTVAFIVVLSLAAGWMAADVMSPQAPAAPAAPVSRGPRPIGSTEPTASYTEQLKVKLRTQPPSPTPRRNLFVFGGRRAPAPRRVEPEAALPAPPAAAVPVLPRFTLSGIAESTVDGQVVRTAIISGSSGLLFAKPGDTLPGGYKVTRVEETYALIMDAAGVEQTLRLK